MNKRNQKKCYYQGCVNLPSSKEHIPPKAFFPEDQRNQLLTEPSCNVHNNSKSRDDMYVLAHICLNTSPANRSRQVFFYRIAKQLGYNNDALRKTISAGSEILPKGAVRYPVDTKRFDDFFKCLSFGIVYKSCEMQLPKGYTTKHVYHNLVSDNESPVVKLAEKMVSQFYSKDPYGHLDFGQVSTQNESIYSVKIFGLPKYKGSLTLVHEFYGVFRVTSMLTKQYLIRE